MPSGVTDPHERETDSLLTAGQNEYKYNNNDHVRKTLVFKTSELVFLARTPRAVHNIAQKPQINQYKTS